MSIDPTSTTVTELGYIIKPKYNIHNGRSGKVTKKLVLGEPILMPADRMSTNALAEQGTTSWLLIPKGTVIYNFKVKVNKGVVLDPALQFKVGYILPVVYSKDTTDSQFDRITGQDKVLNSDLLQKTGCVVFTQKLTGDKLKAQFDLVKKDMVNSKMPAGDIDCSILNDNGYAGELFSLIPAITVLEGVLNVEDLTFEITYKCL